MVRQMASSMLALVAVAGVGIVVPATELPGRSLVLSIEGAAAISPTSCQACVGCGGEWHRLKFSTSDLFYSGGPHGCTDNHDCEDDDECPLPISDEELGQLWVALSTFEGRDLRMVLDAYTFVHYNAGRQALQIEKCGGLVAHLPLTPAQVQSLDPTVAGDAQ